MSPLKINMILPPADLCGGVRVLAIYADRLKKRGHDVTCISTTGRAPLLRRRIKSFVLGRGWPPRPGHTPSHFDAVDVKHHVISPWRPIRDADVPDGDVVIATWWETAEWVNAMSRAKGAKAYLIQHHEVLFQDAPVQRIAATWRMPMQKITISKWLTDLARDVYGDPHAVHIPNSVDAEQFHAPPRSRQARPTVGILYSATKFKGCEIALEAIRLATQKLPDLRVIAFGREAINPEMPLPAGAEYHQQPGQEAIKDIYSQCDVWLCGSHSEGFHLPPMEAMACRCPVVSTRVGGSMDVIDEGVNGYLVEVGDAPALADRLMRVLGLSETDWQRMSDSAWTTAQRYTWEDATQRLEAALRTAIQKSKSRRPTARSTGDQSAAQPASQPASQPA